MSTRQRSKSYLRPLMIPAIAVGFSAYFAWHAWHGSFGIEARRNLELETVRLKSELAKVSLDHVDIERRVALLRAHSLERDMLEERARDILGLASANEVMLLDPAAQQKSISLKSVN